MIAAVLTVVLFASPPSETQSRLHFLHAQKLFAQHDWRRALDEFVAANESAPDELPELWFDIAQCQRNLGHARLAVAAFDRYLALAPDAGDRERVRALIVSLGGKPPAEPKPEVVPVAAPVEPAPAPPPVADVKPVVAESPALPLVPTTKDEPRKPPRRWKLWTGVGVGAAAVAALAVGLGVGLGTAHSSSTAPMTPALGSGVTFDTRSH